MPLEQEVLNIGRQLEKLVGEGKSDNDVANDLLTQLKELPISLDILQKTRIGMAVNVVRKATTREDVQTVAKSLIKSWKKLLDGQEKVKPQRQQSQDSPSLTRSDSSSSNGDVNRKPPANLPVSSKKYISRSKGDQCVRERCREMIRNSLNSNTNDITPAFDVTNIAASIEEQIFLEFKDTNVKYKNRVKSKVMNLRDKKNPELRQLVIEGVISPERFAKMTAEEMASNEMKTERKKITEQAIKDHQLATTGGTSTGQFKCGRCGKRNTTYNQVQTRSADEPMTTFVFCIECGNRWKFC